MLPFSVPQRWQRPLEVAGYGAVALLIGVITLYSSLSRDRVKDALETALSADPMMSQPLGTGMDVQIGDVGLTLFGPGVDCKDIVLRSRPSNPNDKPTRVLIDRVVVHFGIWGMITGHPSYTFRAQAFGGEVRGRLLFEPRLSQLEVHVDKVALGDAQALLGSAIKLPIGGSLSGSIELHLPKGLLSEAKGTVELAVTDGVVGDGKAKLVIPTDPMLREGLTLPRIRLGEIVGRGTLVDGKATLGDWRLHSADADAVLEGTIELRDPWMLSQLHGFLRWKAAESLIKRESIVELLTNATAATAKRSDGWFGYQIAGSLGSPALIPNTTGPAPTVPPPPAHVAAPPPAHPAEPPPVVVAPAAPPPPPPPGEAHPPEGTLPAAAAPAAGTPVAPAAGAPAGASAANPAGLPAPPSVVNSIQPGRHPVEKEEHEGSAPSPATAAPLVAPEPQ